MKNLAKFHYRLFELWHQTDKTNDLWGRNHANCLLFN
jgi:hypothetical protein